MIGEKNGLRPLKGTQIEPFHLVLFRYVVHRAYPALTKILRAVLHTKIIFSIYYILILIQLSTVFEETSNQLWKYAPLRWDQTAQFGFVPNDRLRKVFMAVSMDLGNKYSPYVSFHPTNKRDVGKRLSLAGLAIAYGRNVYYTGPLVSVIKQRKEHSLNVLEITYKFVRGRIEVRSRDGFEVHCHIISSPFCKTFSLQI